MKCPQCQAENPEGAVECGACGVIFAKLQERKAAERRAAEEFLKGEVKAEEKPQGVAPWLVRLAAVVFVVLWLGGMAVYYMIFMARLHRR
jgi:hypothetical protein